MWAPLDVVLVECGNFRAPLRPSTGGARVYGAIGGASS